MTDVKYLEQWRRKSDGSIVFIASVTDFSDATYVTWRRPGGPGSRTAYGRLELSSFLKRYEFREPAPVIRHVPVKFPPEPKTFDAYMTLVRFHNAEFAFHEAKALAWSLSDEMDAELRAKLCRKAAQESAKALAELRKRYNHGKDLPVPVFTPWKSYEAVHDDGFTYEVWQVKENAGWEYRIVGTNVKVVQVDGGQTYGSLLAVVCLLEKTAWDPIAGPSQWSVDNALRYAHRHWLEKHVFEKAVG